MEEQQKLRKMVADLRKVAWKMDRWDRDFINYMYEWRGDYVPRQPGKIRELHKKYSE